MIYVENTNKYPQRVSIPRDDGNVDGLRGYRFQKKDYDIHVNGETYIYPDPGYDGITAGTINVNVPTDTQEAYDNGYADGYQDGYQVGFQDGYNSGTTVSFDLGYASGRTDGYQEGYENGTQDGRQEGYSEGYEAGRSDGYQEGYNAGYETGYQEGIAYQKSLLGSYNFTANTGPDAITFENGISAATVNIPLQSLRLTATTNGEYAYIAQDYLYSDVIVEVDVPRSGASPTLTAGTFDQNGTYGPPAGVDGFSSVIVAVNTAETYNSGYTSGYTEGFQEGEASGETAQKSKLQAFTATTNGTWTREDGWSAVTVNVPQLSGATQIVLDDISKNVPTYGVYYFVYDQHTNFKQVTFTLGRTAETTMVCTYNITTTGDTQIIQAAYSAAWMYVNGEKMAPQEHWSFGSTGRKVIPWGVEGRESVTESAKFTNTTTLESVVIGSGVTNIRDTGFFGCANLTGVTFEAGSKLRKIGYYGFTNCSNLRSITLPASLEGFGIQCFSDCRRLTGVTFEAGSILNSINSQVFARCVSLGSITIPASVKSIGSYAFFECGSLTSITCLATNAPSLGTKVFGKAVEGFPDTGTLHVPTGSDYSTWMAQLPSGWTIDYI